MLMRCFVLACVALALVSCSDDKGTIDRDSGVERRDLGSPVMNGMFRCLELDSQACIGNIHYSCALDGEFYSVVQEDCAAQDKICVEGQWCLACRPGELSCDGNSVVKCRDDGSGADAVEECLIEDSEVCIDGACINTCEQSLRDRSYQGCEFWAADLDNAGIGPGRDASAQPYAVVVSNPWTVPNLVIIERNDALPGEPAHITQVASEMVPPGDLEIFSLPRREVDGASSNKACLVSADCDQPEVCVGTCQSSSGVTTGVSCGGDSDCVDGGTCNMVGGVCRTSVTASGIDDGTHTALTSHAYHVRSQLPIVAYQFNPLDNVGVFSNDASLLLPTSALGREYSVVSWPQTLSDTDEINTDSDIDLRAFLTILGTSEGTQVRVKLGAQVVRVLPGGPVPDSAPGDMLEVTLNPYDVLNLETKGFNADFTGTTVSASQSVSVFVGSEASDAPRFADLRTRQCCADHLEEQLIPNSTLGREFIIGRMPPRTAALNAAFVDPSNTVGLYNEPEWVRVLAVAPGVTTLHTSLASPNDTIDLAQGDDVILKADQDFLITANLPVSVVQVLPSQDAVGIPSRLPGGDPSIIVVPPIQQYRNDYVLLTPLYYGFDFVTILAENNTEILLDGAPLPSTCSVSPADGIARMPGDPPPTYVIHRCQLSYPDVIVRGNLATVDDGSQGDGVHTILANRPVGVVVYGFDAYVSYGYAGGLNLDIIN